ncbi:hypothetical protein K503DRAFT_805747 [Rhizopogon vinicolor AM-OR11-026]|uniref:Uncharacterized protein n=1 Tax=Rhizopogon vinicolor AM-OR11-026 TaxID=1314800 RepID=A0A1B7MGU6_9AGAM|nr:hypothetical protein K503DRAFT_805747 [Rhizopogon vinicolor AM-OR11-026]
MNVAGPPRQHAVPGARATNDCEEGPIRMVAQLDLTDIDDTETDPAGDENRLLAAAEQRVDAQLQVAPRTAPAVPRPAPFVNIWSTARHAEANARVAE